MVITLLVVGILGAVAGHGEFEAYLRNNKALGQAIAAMICLYGESTSVVVPQLPQRAPAEILTLPVFAFNVAWGPIAWVV
jgi:SP family sugar:H+ symporter-like MFS transporter